MVGAKQMEFARFSAAYFIGIASQGVKQALRGVHAFFYVTFAFLADILYALIDPRIRYE